jgi:4-hydroxythreonine-4-phosphate dehydrogenase
MNAPLAITMGCPSGIGPEIILRFFAQRCAENVNAVVLGDMGVLIRAAQATGGAGKLVSWTPGSRIVSGTIPVMELSKLDLSQIVWGKPGNAGSFAMADYIRTAVSGCSNGDFAAMVTCPISKKSLNDAGIKFPGHTEMLAELTRTRHYKMMMAGSRLRVVLVTIHEPLSEVKKLVTLESVRECLAMTVDSLQKDFGLKKPKVAVAGLNPHCGEQGMFGCEDRDILQPVVDQYIGAGEISGPWPPDTVFYKAAQGAFDAVIAMYHDQGLIPFKLLHFKDGVNVTLGLPVVRTSVDHGTAYDIAGQGVADSSSLEAAFFLARRIVDNRKRWKRNE